MRETEPIPFDITDRHIGYLTRWVNWHRKRWGDSVDWESVAFHALYRAWATYRPAGKPREFFHLRHHLRSERSNTLRKRQRRRAILHRSPFPRVSLVQWWAGFAWVDYLDSMKKPSDGRDTIRGQKQG